MKAYSVADRHLKTIKSQIQRECNTLSLLGFDEINTLKNKRRLNKMFKRLMDLNDKCYLNVGKQALEDAIEFLILYGFDVRDYPEVDKQYITDILGNYYSVTGYLYYAETERKKERLKEAMMTAKETGQRSAYDDAVKRFGTLWYTQSQQYAIDTVNTTMFDTYQRNGVKKVRWVTQKDEKVCSECNPRDGVIFDIDNVPMSHYRCRCYLVPVS